MKIVSIHKDMSSEPKYRHIYELLRERILQLPPGERLETVRSLQKNYGVSLATVNSALRLLTEEGLIESVRKQGIFRGHELQAAYASDRQ